MLPVQTRRYIALGIAVIALIASVAYAAVKQNSVIVKNDAEERGDLVLQEEFDIDEATRNMFLNRMAVAEAAIDARAEVDDVDQYLLLALASDADFIGDLAKAKQVYEMLLQENPIDYVALSNYGGVLARMGDIEAADEAYWQALNVNASETQFEKYIRFLNMHGGEDGQARVKEMFELAVTIHGQKKWLMTGLAQWYYDNGDCEQSIAHLEVALQLDPEDEYVAEDLEKVKEVCK